MGAEWVMSWVGDFSYPAVFLLLLACGLGAPLSEDVIVLVGGTVAAQTHGSFVLMALTAYLGKLGGDVLIFRVGRKLGPRALSLPRFKKLFTPARVKWIETHFERHGVLSVFLARFLPGLRAPTYLVAGASGFSPRKFLLADMVAAGFSAPVLTWLGYRYGMKVLDKLHEAFHGIFAVVGGLVVIALVVHWIRARRRAKRALKETPDAVLDELPTHVKQREA